MVATKRFRAHERCQTRIQKYLEVNKDGSSRAIERWVFNLGRHADEWAETMDRTRAFYGNDSAPRRGKTVMYNHFILSPDPKDECDIDTLRDFVSDWVSTWFGNEWGAGKLGQYQVAVVVHDDNENGILHAHVVVNNTDLQSAKRLQINKKDNAALVKSVQDIGGHYGLSPIVEDGEREERSEMDEVRARSAILDTQEVIDAERGRSISKGERELLERGAWSWKAELADLIDIALYSSETEGQFVVAMQNLGVVAEVRDGQYLFRHPSNPERFSIYGDRLGKAYGRAEIDRTLAARRDSQARRQVKNWNFVHEHVAQFILGRLKDSPALDGSITPDILAEALKVIDLEGLKSTRRAQVALNAARALAAAAVDPDVREEAERRAESIAKAIEVAEKFGLFYAGDRAEAEVAERYEKSRRGGGGDAGAVPSRTATAARGESKAKGR